MAVLISELRIHNYRCLQGVGSSLGDVTVLFGPNGAGKSALLDALWFVRDCAVNGAEKASSRRSHGVGLRWDRADPDEPVEVMLTTSDASYVVRVGYSAGRMEPFPGEELTLADGASLIQRRVGATEASLRNFGTNRIFPHPLREPERLSLGLLLDFDARWTAAAKIDSALRNTRFHHSRSVNLFRLRTDGSEAGYDYYLSERGENLFSVLRNLQARSSADDRYQRVMHYMAQAFPGFSGLVLDPVGVGGVYGRFVIDGLHEPVYASGVSDGHLQMLLVLTALFAEERPSLLLLDEPDLSLHPWALATLAEACIEAAGTDRRQVVLATHSPVLLSQFEPAEVLAFETADGATRVSRLSEIGEIADLLDQYSLGSLYMAQAVAAQQVAAVPGA